MNDLRYALRTLARQPGLTAVAVCTIALCIGATTAIFAALERVVLDPLPYPQNGRLVQLRSAVPAVGPGAEWDVSEGAWFFFRNEASTLDALGAFRREGANVVGRDHVERATVAAITARTLGLFGARPVLGRLIDEQDDDPGAPPVAVLSNAYWRRAFGADPEVIGTTVYTDERPHEIVGVMAPGVELPTAAGLSSELGQTDLWVPLVLNPAGPFYNAHVRFRTIARLAPGATLAGAQTELDGLTARLPEAVPSAYSTAFMERTGFATRVYPLKDYVVGEIGRSLWILFGAVGLVLLIACANVANLLVVRSEARRRELAIRAALGARAAAISRQFLAEGLVLALAGGLLGLALAFWGVDSLAALAPTGIPRLAGLRPDGSVVAFTVGLSLLVAVGVAALPALRARRVVRVSELAEGGRGTTVGRERQRLRSALVMAQVALALVLIVGAGLLLQSVRRLRAVDIGVQPEGVLTARLYLPSARYDSVPPMWRFYEASLERIRALPGIRAAGLTSSLPLAGGFGCTIQGFADAEVMRRIAESGFTTCAGQEPVSPGYFDAMGIPVVRGRALSQADFDQPERGSVVVSRAFADRFWPGEDPIGKEVGPSGRTDQQFYRVVGVVGDVYASSPAGEPAIAIYYPIARIPGTTGLWPNPATLVVKTASADAMALLPSIQAAIESVDPAIPLADVTEMRTIVDHSMARLSFMMTLIGIAGAAALLLAAIGLYGVVSYIVTRRTNEIGLRIALGAQPARVAGLVVARSVQLAVLGAAVGVLVALAASHVLSSQLYGVEPTQPAVYLAAAVLLSAVAAVAAFLPARRAARIDPMEALRDE